MSEVRVTADLDIVGKIAQFGRGMIESVNKQMFRQFTECVRATLESQPPAAAEPSASTAEAKPAAPAAAPPVAAPPVASPPDNTRVAPQVAPTVQPVRILPLIGRAVWEMLAGLVRRIFGRKPA
jgi:hypothetical protein